MSNTLRNEPSQRGKELDSSTGTEHRSGSITYTHTWVRHTRSGKGCIPPGLAAARCPSPPLKSPWGIACFFLPSIREHLLFGWVQGMPSVFGCAVERERTRVWEGAAEWQSPVWHTHAVCHRFLFCSRDLWPSEWLQLHALSFVRHYLILQRDVLVELCTW